MSIPARRPTIVHLLAEARRCRQALLEPSSKKPKTVPMGDLTGEKTRSYKDELFTGMAVAKWPDGAVAEEQSFVKGVKEGVHRVYDPSGRMLEETLYRANAIEGISWTWHDNGQLSGELFAVAGVPLFRRNWDDRGELTEEYKLDENDWRYARVLKKLEERSVEGRT